MITFRHREDVAPSVLILLSILTLAATLVYMLVVPMPTADAAAKGRGLTRKKLMDEISFAKIRKTDAATVIKPKLWEGTAEAVTAEALAQVTKQATSHGVKLAAFRPQRPQAFDGTTELEYSVQISGTYPGVRAVIASLDAAESKIVLQSIQITTAEGAPSAVTATLGLSAFVDAEPVVSPTAVKGGSHA